MEKRKFNWIALVIVVVVVVGMVIGANILYDNQQWFKDLFSPTPGIVGEVTPDSSETIAAQGAKLAKISMLIFTAITALQFIAFVVCWNVVSGISKSDENASLKLVRLEASDIFFDVPLYVGLFGTISAFLVMTFSPQSSRLIAYSSTLIGIIFSLFLRVVLNYPLRQRLEGEKAESAK